MTGVLLQECSTMADIVMFGVISRKSNMIFFVCFYGQLEICMFLLWECTAKGFFVE